MAFTPYNPTSTSTGFKPYEPTGSQPDAVSATKPDSFLSMATRVAQALPGAQLGKAVGTSIYNISDTLGHLAKGDLQGAADVATAGAKETNASWGRVAADTAQAALTPASMIVGGPEAGGIAGLAARVGTSGALGAGAGALSAAADGESAPDIGTKTLEGGALGAAGQGVGEAFSAALKAIPSRLTRSVLPKLTPGNEEYALANTKIGSVGTLLSDSKTAVANLGHQVQTVLSHPDYVSHVGQEDQALKTTLEAFPNSEYTPESIVTTLKGLVPGQAKIVGKVADGTATLQEKNTLRSAMDAVVKKAYGDHPQVTASKQVGVQFANALRAEVQSEAPETQPIFAKLSQEIDLRNALQQAKKTSDNAKAISLKDILSYMTLGVSGLAGEKAVSSPGVALTAAKVFGKIGDGARKLAPVAKALRVPAIMSALKLGQAAPTDPALPPQ